MSNDTPPAPKPWYQRVNPRWVKWGIGVLAPILSAVITAWIMHQPVGPLPPPPPVPDEPFIVQKSGGSGWVKPTEEEADQAIKDIEAAQGVPAKFSRYARDAGAGDDGKTVIIWPAEKKVLGKQLGSWNQGMYGTCVSFGFGRGVQDLILIQIAGGAAEQWPGAEVATEAIYGGSRVQVGKGRIRGDGSVGAWAAQWIMKWGVVFREVYFDRFDLRTYSGELSRKWGSQGVPAAIQTLARQHPVKSAARVDNAEELWTALGNTYPVPVCSDYGFEGKVPRDGIFSHNGEWGHCMLFRGRFTHPTKGRCVVVQNSWGDYLRQRVRVQTTDMGEIELPEGCFAITLATAGQMCAEHDSFALSGFVGFPKRDKLDWYSAAPTPRRPKPAAFVFALAQ